MNSKSKRDGMRLSRGGFLCTDVSADDIERLASDPRILLIEEDFITSPALSGGGTQWATWNGEYTWFLDRLDEPSWSQHDGTYDVCPYGDTSVAYVIDNGVRTTHEQFAPARAVGFAFDNDSVHGYSDPDGCSSNADMWHGTAVAGSLAGFGVGSSRARVVSLRVFACYNVGSASWLINAINWIGSDANDPFKGVDVPKLVNYSGAVADLDGQDFGSLNAVASGFVAAYGIPFFTSANNYSADACHFAPAAAAYTNVNKSGKVFSVAGTTPGPAGDPNDYRWQVFDNGVIRVGVDSGSNSGDCISIYAPAASIYVALNTGNAAYAYKSGTSFSSPLVAGIAARYMEKTNNKHYTQVYDYLLTRATTAVYNTTTPEYWFCPGPSSNPPASLTPISCPAGFGPLQHFTSKWNSSNAGMIFSDLSCQ